MNIPQPNTLEIIALSLMGFVWIWQFVFLLRRIRPVALYQTEAPISESLPPVSVVISARNEAKNLEKFLPSVLEQDYPEFQVVVVNDGSEDETDMVLARFKAKYDNLYYTTIAPDKKFYHGKKLPLSLGIKAAKHEHMVMTDADCQPSSEEWLRHMVSSLIQQDKELTLGIGNYKKEKGLNNLWLRYDTFTIAMQYLGFALSGKPYMATGRNMAYTKTLFNRTKGFKKHIYIASGDDDLFVQEAATKSNTAVCLNSKAHTLSVPPRSFKKWKEQKQRHLSTSAHYSTGTKSPLIMEPLTRELFWTLTVIFIFFPNFATIVLPFSLLLLLFKLLLWKKAADKTGMGKIFWGLFLFDIIQPIILGFIHFENLTGSKKRKWK
ncbi:glycosyltransferase [Marinilabilia rubra]|uniref:Transmembrane glycosyltransferase n=1 Tax=Marinilabilia rubra TaxID=2162893 RepID=A0A2U2B8F2_9BACT|nr:glycosyltransferase [Marinilabilia rubra]PWD99323.1 transmembrane glycosyltransferase [Marinilabilia rubra]